MAISSSTPFNTPLLAVSAVNYPFQSGRYNVLKFIKHHNYSSFYSPTKSTPRARKHLATDDDGGGPPQAPCSIGKDSRTNLGGADDWSFVPSNEYD